ncbi:EamA family transporter RarD [bacterium]|nr:EamA family transporter RarD [bacterium]
MNKQTSDNVSPSSLLGLMSGLTAFLIWGLSPIYWKELRQVPALEVILHRIVWSFLFLMPIIILRGRWKEFLATIRNPKACAILMATALFVSINWLIYIWAVTNDHLLQASLGYYINPLVNVLLGMLFLKERFRHLQTLSLIIAAGGVLYLTLYFGQFPWISLILAFTFGFYGLIRKMVAVASLVGLAIETLMLSVPAGITLVVLYTNRTGVFLQTDTRTDLFLLGASVVTAIPLLLFTISARQLKLSTVGFMQYLAPTCMFLLGIFVYHEPFAMAQVITFILIWIALALYSLDSILYYRRS